MGADGFYHGGAYADSLPLGVAEPLPDWKLADRAAMGFARACPGKSAITAMAPEQAQAALRLFSALGLFGLACPDLLVAAASVCGLILFALVLGWRCCLVSLSAIRKPDPADFAAGRALPVYTLLIALKDEAEIVPQLSLAIAALDYPSACIDLKLLIEAGDTATADAIRDEAWPLETELLVLPPGLPRTKPRALNYGLARARGEFLVVYDAEDRPDPSQLRAAVAAFRAGPDRLACVQAPLLGEGASTWIAAQWSLEYAIQFGHVLPSLARLGLPIALGGTSNHFRTSRLKAVEGWDPWNVTEDADLGLRLASLGQAVGTILPPTREAPPASMPIWIAQRSRWLKGFLQTWLVLMRDPRGAVRAMGLGGFLSMQLTLGGAILSAVVHGPWAVWCLACLVWPGLTLGPVAMTAALVSYLCGMAVALAAPGQKGRTRALCVLTLPFYWPLQTLAMIRAVYGIVRCPHFWAKTPHTGNRGPLQSDPARRFDYPV